MDIIFKFLFGLVQYIVTIGLISCGVTSVIFMLFIICKEFYISIKKFRYNYLGDSFENGIEIISIDGNIGVGKSTFIKMLKNYYKNNNDIEFIDEPVNEWINVTDENNENILSKFYKNKGRWSYTFQNFAFITRLHNLMKVYNKLLKEINSEYTKYQKDKESKTSHNVHNKKIKMPIKKIIIVERSFETDKNVFAKILYDKNYIDELEYNIYLSWYNKLVPHFPKIKNIIYLQAPTAICYERIKRRRRTEEKEITKGYLDEINDCHDKWFAKKKKNIVTIDCSANFLNDIDNKLSLIKQTDSFIKKIFNNGQ